MELGRVVLTGGTGFIGSYLAEELVAQGYQVLALRRTQSDPWRVAAVQSQLTWINIEKEDWKEKLLSFQPNYLVHSAWVGVEAGQRDDWQSQLYNLTLTMQLLQVLVQGPLKKIIVLGSQAEYGAFEGRITEEYITQPIAAYGAVKLAILDLIRTFCQTHALEWYWLRVFAVFGPREDAHWFVSFVATALLRHTTPDLTGCEQHYDYLFAKDLARAIVQTLPAAPGLNGVYNIGANRATSLKEIVDTLQNLIGENTSVNYGALPYRAGQVMHMEGNSDKFERVFGPIVKTPLSTALKACVDFVKQTL